MEAYKPNEIINNKKDEKIFSDLNYFIYRKVKDVFQNRKNILEFEQNKAIKKTKIAYINSLIEPKRKNPYRIVTNLLKKIISNKISELEKGQNEGSNTKRNALKLENVDNENSIINMNDEKDIDKNIFNLNKGLKSNNKKGKGKDNNFKLALNKIKNKLNNKYNDDSPSSLRKNKPILYPNNHVGFIEKDYSDINSVKLSEHSFLNKMKNGISFIKERNLTEKENHISVSYF